MTRRSICVFCGSSSGTRPAYTSLARDLGHALARRGWRLVYGGGAVGLMGTVADAVLEAGGEVIGVIPHGLAHREVGHTGITKLHLVDSMHERKAMMAELADGFVAMPGGLGTIEELFEVLTWAQLGIHRKPCALLDAQGYYAGLIAFLEHQVAEGFVRPTHRSLLLVDDDPEALLERMTRYVPPSVERWLDRRET